MNPGSVGTIWPHLATLALLVALGTYSRRQHSVPAARNLAIACLLAGLWVAGAAGELLAGDFSAKLLWFKFQALCQLPANTAMTCFVLEYVQPGRWLTRRTVTLLSIPPLLASLVIVTNDLHHWFWTGFLFDGAVVPLRRPIFYVLFAYSLSLVVANVVALVWLFIRSPQHRWPVALMLVAHIGGRIEHAVELFSRQGTFGWDPLLGTFMLVYGVYGIALFGFRILDPLPAARQAATEQMRDGLVVLDTGRRVLSLNPAAEAMLRTRTLAARGRLLPELVPALQVAGPSLTPGQRLEAELSCSGEPRRYVLDLSPLHDHRGLLVGYLLLLRDVTEQRRAQAQVVEQQRALAMLQERQQMARELHDSLGQTLGYVSMEAQAVQKRLADGEVDAARGQLTRLAEVAQEAHAELRGSILGLRAGAPGDWSLFGALRQHLASYQDHYGITTKLVIQPGLEDGDLLPGLGVQLMRVIQEALANAQKHGHASRVDVTFEREAGSAQVVVADDGCGFDADRPAPEGEHWGLMFMRERMTRVGGSLSVESRPGAGTRIALRVPLRDGGERP